MYEVTVKIEVRREGQYGSQPHALSSRTTSADEESLQGTVQHASAVVVGDTLRQINIRADLAAPTADVS